MNNVKRWKLLCCNNTPYVTGNGLIQVTESLKEASGEFFCCFANNQMKANPDKCHFVLSSCDEVSIGIENLKIKSSN